MIQKTFIDTGRVRLISHDLPLEMHPNAIVSAQAARCAGEQGQFWQMRNWMMGDADKLSIDNIEAQAEAAFQLCIENKKYRPAINADVAEATRVGVNGTAS